MLSLLLGTLLTETAALVWLAVSTNAAAAFSGYLPLHALACGLGAFAALPMFPPAYRRPQRWVIVLVFGVSFFVPLLGIGAILIGVAAGRFFPQLLKPRVFESVANPEYTMDQNEALQRPRGAAARARVLNPSASTAMRLESLVALGNSNTVAMGSLLRDLLTDPVDDVRLLAYGLLEQREKDISHRLASERRLLEVAQGMDERETVSRLCGRVAHLYWELVYQGLAQGDTARYALEQTLIHAERSLREQTTDGPTWLLIARVRLRRHEWDPADGALNEALKWNVPRRTALPYLAQLRFSQRRYAEVRAIMYELGGQRDSGNLSPNHALLAAQQYWAA